MKNSFIIDAHGHADCYEAYGWIDPPQKVVQLMDMAGIDITCVTTYGEATVYDKAISNLKEYTEAYPDRLIGFVRINPASENAVQALEEAAKIKGIKGVKLHPVTNLIKPYSRFTQDIMNKAAQLDMPVFFHCGDEIAALPLEIGEGAALCPQTTIICHMGGFFHSNEAIRMAKEHPNVILDTSSVPYPEVVKKAVDELGSERVVFATDNPAGDPISEVAKIKMLGFKHEDEENIFWRNMAKILKLDEIRGVKI